MEKRRAEVTPLKKIAYSTEEEGKWWDRTASLEILQKRTEAVYAQMEEYKTRAYELEEEKNKVLQAKIDAISTAGSNEIILQEITKALLSCEEHTQQISQLRARLRRQAERPEDEPWREQDVLSPSAHTSVCAAANGSAETSEDPTKPNSSTTPSSPNGPNTPNGPSSSSSSSSSALKEEEIKELMEKVDSLERRIELSVCKHPPNYAPVLKSLELENADLAHTIKTLSSKVEQEVLGQQATSKEKRVLESTVKELQESIDVHKQEKAALQEEAEKEKQILQKRVDELYLTIEKINTQMIEYGRELEKENRETSSCTEACRARIKEMEDKEIDRVEEVSYLVRQYVDTAQENDGLKLSLEKSTAEILHMQASKAHAPGSIGPVHALSLKENEEKLHEKCSALSLELEKSKLEYLERKSSAQYHKRKAAQFEAELCAARKTAADLEALNQSVQQKLDALKAQKLPSSQNKELELYQKMMRCAICSVNIKNSILRKCMHLMCRDCVDERFKTRQRTCPLCGVGFSLNDISPVYL
ncbi:hypothetical protein NECID01_1101 [Nematocida sp. AWRm77]|nr:hypothetical protein NECID01_1101 [Nematocida sp. AWRm77]